MAIHPIVVGIFLNPRMLHRMLHRCCLSKTSLPSEWKKKICSFRNQCAVLPYCEGFCQGKKNKNKTTICYVCAHQEIAEIFYGQIHGTSYAKQCNDVGIWVMWCEMPLYNKMRDNPSPAGGHPQWLECYLCGPRAAAGTPANLALSKECQWVMKLFLKYGTVMTTNALHYGQRLRYIF